MHACTHILYYAYVYMCIQCVYAYTVTCTHNYIYTHLMSKVNQLKLMNMFTKLNFP